MNISKSNQKFTRNIKLAFTFLVLQLFFITNAQAIKLTLNGQPPASLDINAPVLNIKENIYYSYSESFKPIVTDSNSPFLCIGPSTGTSPNVSFDTVPSAILEAEHIETGNNNPFRVYGDVGISSANYNYDLSTNYDPADRVFNLITDVNSQCVVKGFEKVDNPTPGNPFVFVDSFETGGIVPSIAFPDLDIVLENIIDNQVVSNGNSFTYEYKITNIGDTELTFDLVDYFSQTNTIDTSSCSRSNVINDSCGTESYVDGFVYLKDAYIKFPGDNINVSVTRTATIPSDTSIDLLVSALVTNSIDIYQLNNSDTIVLSGVTDATSPIITEGTPVDDPTNNDTPTYEFNSNEAGTLNFTNCNGSSISSSLAVSIGINNIVFGSLAADTYTGCKLSVSDASNNQSNELIIPDFTVDLTAPTEEPVFNPVFFPGPTITTVSNNTIIVGACGSGATNGKISYRSSTGNELNSEPTETNLSGQSFSSVLIWNSDGSKNFLAKCVDAAGNSGPEVSLNVFVDLIGPTMMVEQGATQSDPTSTNSAQFTVIFNEPIDPNSFISSDISISGTNTGSVTSGPTRPNVNDSSIWEFTITGMTNNETVLATIASSTVEDLYGNENTQSSTSVDNSITYITALVEFHIDSSGPENNGANLPMLLINGNVSTNTTVVISDLGTGTGTIPNDYTFSPSVTVTIPSGSYNGLIGTAIPITGLTIENDSIVEMDQTIDFEITSIASDVNIGDANGDFSTNINHTYTIENDDGATLSINNVTVNEGDSGPVALTFIITLSGEIENEVSVPLSISDVTTNNQDYSFTGASMVLSAGSINGSFHSATSIFIIGDTVIETDETFEMTLGTPSLSGVTTTAVGTGTITNDD